MCNNKNKWFRLACWVENKHGRNKEGTRWPAVILPSNCAGLHVAWADRVAWATARENMATWPRAQSYEC